MNPSDYQNPATELRVFVLPSEPELPDTNLVLSDQLPFMPALARNFEAATGWQVSFAETKASHDLRLSTSRPLPVLGNFRISDMSESMESGKPVRHLGACDRLAESLDEMIRIIQTDRRSLLDIDRRLNSIVELPFAWWGLTGNAGFCDGAISAWSITPSEKIRLFAGQIQAPKAIESVIGAASVVAAFETTCLASFDLADMAALLPKVLRKTSRAAARFTWFASIELDPITGDFGIDGFESSQGLTWVDVQASTALSLDEAGSGETLYSGQVLGVGVNARQRLDLNEIMANSELTVFDFRRIVERKFADSAALFLYRK